MQVNTTDVMSGDAQWAAIKNDYQSAPIFTGDSLELAYNDINPDLSKGLSDGNLSFGTVWKNLKKAADWLVTTPDPEGGGETASKPQPRTLPLITDGLCTPDNPFGLSTASYAKADALASYFDGGNTGQKPPAEISLTSNEADTVRFIAAHRVAARDADIARDAKIEELKKKGGGAVISEGQTLYYSSNGEVFNPVKYRQEIFDRRLEMATSSPLASMLMAGAQLLGAKPGTIDTIGLLATSIDGIASSFSGVPNRVTGTGMSRGNGWSGRSLSMQAESISLSMKGLKPGAAVQLRFNSVQSSYEVVAAPRELLPSGAGGTGANYNPSTGQGIYVLRDEYGAVRYVGRGDAPARVRLHAESPDKSDLSSTILWTNNLTKAQAKGLEQALIDHFGGAISQNPNTALLNRIRSYSSANPNASTYRNAVTDTLWQATLQKLGR